MNKVAVKLISLVLIFALIISTFSMESVYAANNNKTGQETLSNEGGFSSVEPSPSPQPSPTPVNESNNVPAEFKNIPIDPNIYIDSHIKTAAASGAERKIVNLTFVIDSTGSMWNEIENVKQGIADFASYIAAKDVILRMAIIDYKDITCDGKYSTVVHKPNYSVWTSDVPTMVNELNSIEPDGGGDYDETLVDALGYVVDDATMTYNSDAYKFAFVMTDAGTKDDNNFGYTGLAAVTSVLKSKGIHTTVVTDTSYGDLYDTYNPLVTETGGIMADIYENFETTLKDYADSILGVVLKPKKAIYVLPGYMGSRLYDNVDGTEFWLESGKIKDDVMAYKLPLGDTSHFMLDENGNGEQQKTDITQDKYGTSMNKSEGDYKEGEYVKLIKRLQTEFGDSYDVIFFPYDWRVSLGKSVNALTDHINSNKYEKVDFVCHSTGGLLAAAYIGQSRENKLKVEGVVTLGSPLFGTYSALEPLETGKTAELPGILSKMHIPDWQKNFVYDWAKAVTRNSPCTYQLLPSKEYLNYIPQVYTKSDGSSWVTSINDYYKILSDSNSNLNNNMINGSGESHKKYRDTYVKGSIVNIFKEVKSLHIGSTGIDTIAIACYQYNLLGQSVYKAPRIEKDGDGTVLINSALAMPNKNQYPLPVKKFMNIKHGDLVKTDTVLNEVMNFIRNVNVLETAEQPQYTLNADTGTSMETSLQVDVQGNMDVHILNASGSEVASVVEGVPSSEFDGVSFSNYFLDTELNNFTIIMPNAGYKIQLIPRAGFTGPAEVVLDISTLYTDGSKSKTLQFEASVNSGDIVIFDAIAGITASNLQDSKLQISHGTNTDTLDPASVKQDYAQSLSITEQLTIGKEETQQITASVSPSGMDINWSSSNDSVATVDSNGWVAAVDYGTANITAVTADGNKYAVCKVTVPLNAVGIAFEASNIDMQINEKTMLNVTYNPANATNRDLTFISDAPEIVSVGNDGVATALQNGSATITATTDNGINTQCNITVYGTIAVSGITLDPASPLTMNVGETRVLTAIISPSNATLKDVVWYSSDPEIVSVNPSGGHCEITVNKRGYAYVTAVTQDGGYSASIEINNDKDTIAAAQALDIGVEYSGALNYADDYNFYKFTVVNPGTYRIGTVSDIDTFGYLYYYTEYEADLDYNLITTDDDSEDLDFLIETYLDPGDYLVKVKGYGDEVIGSYSIAVNSVYTVNFNTQGGNTIPSITSVLYNQLINPPINPVLTGYTFVAWYKDSACRNIWNFAIDRVTENITLYAKWIQTSYTITFDSQGGNVIPAQNVFYDQAIQKPNDPVRESYIFIGWYKEQDCISEWNFSSDTATVSRVLYAKWLAAVPVNILCEKSDVTLYCGSNGTITVVASGGNSGSYNYSIDGGASWQNSGYFSGLAAGTYTAAVRDAVYTSNIAICSVTVGQPSYMGSISAKKISSTANAGTAVTLVPPAAPKGYTIVSVTYSSSNPSVASIETNGNVTFLAGGKATIIITITAQTTDSRGKVKTKTTTVKKTVTVKQPVRSISLNLTNTAIARTQKVKLAALLAPVTASNKKVTWKSSNPKVAAVSSSGVVTGKAGGTAIITCTAKDGSGVSASCTVTVTPIYPSGLKLSKTALTIKTGKTASLKATIAPKNTDFKTVTWTSSNPAVVVVDIKGKVRAVAPGTATITATTTYGQTASCIVTVQ